MTPEQLRVAFHADAPASPAVAAFRAFLTSGKAAEDAFYQWLAEPMTQAVTRAIEELADNPPVYGDREGDLAVQYGMTTGLQIAAKLMTQPRRLFPEVFRDAASPDTPLDRAFTTNADAAIDNM